MGCTRLPVPSLWVRLLGFWELTIASAPTPLVCNTKTSGLDDLGIEPKPTPEG